MMTKLFQFAVLFLCFISTTEAQYVKNNFFVPPNGIQLNDTLFIDKTEVANIHYLEYLHYIKQDTLSILKGQDYLNDSLYYSYLKNNKDSLSQVALIQENLSFKKIIEIRDSIYKAYLSKNKYDIFLNSLLPDFHNDKNFHFNNYKYKLWDDFSLNYFNNPNFRFLPVIALTYDQVQNYCKWRSKVVTDLTNKKQEYSGYIIEVEYRLPSIAEWEQAARGSLSIDSFPYGYKLRSTDNYEYIHEIRKWKYCKKCLKLNGVSFNSKQKVHAIEFNVLDDFYWSDTAFACYNDTLLRPVFQEINRRDTSQIQLTNILTTLPNSLGLYNMIGNVAEMTQEKGVAKGGSFKHRMKDFNLKTNFKYTFPDDWIGFRCMAIVRIRRKE